MKTVESVEKIFTPYEMKRITVKYKKDQVNDQKFESLKKEAIIKITDLRT